MNERLVDVKAGMRMMKRRECRRETGKVQGGRSLGSRDQNRSTPGGLRGRD